MNTTKTLSTIALMSTIYTGTITPASAEPVVRSAGAFIKPLAQAQQPSLEGMLPVQVYAAIDVVDEQYNVADNPEYRMRIDVSARQPRVDAKGAPVMDGTTPVMEEVPVKDWYIQVWASPKTIHNGPNKGTSSENDSRDDVLIAEYRTTYSPGMYLTGVEIDARSHGPMETFSVDGGRSQQTRPNSILGQFQNDDQYFVYTQGYVEVITAQGIVSLRLPTLADAGTSLQGPSYDTVNIINTGGNRRVSDNPLVGAWLAAGNTTTNGGFRYPRWNHTSTDKARAFRAHPNTGREWAVLPTEVYDTSEQPIAAFNYDGSQIVRTDCDGGPCVEQYRELYQLLGVDAGKIEKDRDGNVTYIETHANGKSKNVLPIQAGISLDSRLDGWEKTSWLLDSGSWSRYIETTRIDNITERINLREFEAPDGRKDLVPEIAGIFVLRAQLQEYRGFDTNSDGFDDTFTWETVAQRYTVVEYYPGGREGQYFAGGLLIGGAAGYLVGELLNLSVTAPTIPGILAPVPSGTGTSGREGNTSQENR